MVVAVMEKEEYEVGGQNLYKNHFTCYTDNTKKKKAYRMYKNWTVQGVRNQQLQRTDMESTRITADTYIVVIQCDSLVLNKELNTHQYLKQNRRTEYGRVGTAVSQAFWPLKSFA